MSNNFFKYYYENVLKQWWSLLLLFVSFISSFIFEGTSFIIKLALFLGILLIGLLIIHFFALYKLWKVKNNEAISIGPENIPDDIYENIAKMVDKFIPQKSKDFRENFSEAQKLFRNSSSNTKLLIIKHFTSYKIIKDFFDKNNIFTIKSNDITTIKNKFDKNFSDLNEYIEYVGKNETKEIDDGKVRNIILKINDNLISLFSYL
jgi:hypothetical protein